EPPSAAQGAIAERLAWTYPHRAATTIAAKTSVTEMKRVLADGAAHAAEAESLEDAAARVALGEPGSAHGEAADGQAVRSRATGAPAGLAPLSPHSFRLRRPRFMEEKTLTPAERGTVSHLVMQHMPLDSELDEQAVRSVVASMIERKLLSASQAQAVD